VLLPFDAKHDTLETAVFGVGSNNLQKVPRIRGSAVPRDATGCVPCRGIDRRHISDLSEKDVDSVGPVVSFKIGNGATRGFQGWT
jgi:hypothetical protein